VTAHNSHDKHSIQHIYFSKVTKAASSGCFIMGDACLFLAYR